MRFLRLISLRHCLKEFLGVFWDPLHPASVFVIASTTESTVKAGGVSIHPESPDKGYGRHVDEQIVEELLGPAFEVLLREAQHFY